MRQRLTAELLRRIYRDTDPSMPAALLAGTGRSGTTWVAELIESQVPCRIMFEPFHPGKVPEYRRFHYFQYMAPDARDDALLDFCRLVFAGALRGPWVDGHLAHLRPRFRLVKDIRPTLMLRWIRTHFPDLPIVFTIRHPCAVVLSRMRLGWATDRDLAEFLCQPELVQDHLGAYASVLDALRTEEEKHAAIWCISNLVPLRQFRPGEWTLLFYEHLRGNPESEIPRLFGSLGVPYDRDVFTAMRRPSRTTRNIGEPLRAARGRADWQQCLTQQQIGRILAVVGAFGLDHLYDETAEPRVVVGAV